MRPQSQSSIRGVTLDTLYLLSEHIRIIFRWGLFSFRKPILPMILEWQLHNENRTIDAKPDYPVEEFRRSAFT